MTRPLDTKGLSIATQPLVNAKIARGCMALHHPCYNGLCSRAGAVEPSHSTPRQPGLRSFWQIPILALLPCRPGLLFDFFQSRNVTRLEIGFLVPQKPMCFDSQCLHPSKNGCAMPSNDLSSLIDRQVLRRAFVVAHSRHLLKFVPVAIVTCSIVTSQISVAYVLTSVAYVSYNTSDGYSLNS